MFQSNYSKYINNVKIYNNLLKITSIKFDTLKFDLSF